MRILRYHLQISQTSCDFLWWWFCTWLWNFVLLENFASQRRHAKTFARFLIKRVSSVCVFSMRTFSTVCFARRRFSIKRTFSTWRTFLTCRARHYSKDYILSKKRIINAMTERLYHDVINSIEIRWVLVVKSLHIDYFENFELSNFTKI